MRDTRTVRSEHQDERTHFEVIRALTGNEFNAIKYLYDRLNIIDAKTSALLRFNALLFGIITLVVSVGLRSQSPPSLLNYWWQELIFVLVFLTIAVSTIFCFQMLPLQFDHVTDAGSPVDARITEKCECTKQAMDVAQCRKPEMCLLRLLMAAKSEKKRTLADYENLFFSITIRRLTCLRWAIRLAVISALLSAALMLSMTIPAMHKLLDIVKGFCGA
jgi:hypothetical protein